MEHSLQFSRVVLVVGLEIRIGTTFIGVLGMKKRSVVIGIGIAVSYLSLLE